MPTPEQHALLSASSSHRWLRCTRAPRLEAAFPDTSSPYAAAGTLAHAMAEIKARNYFVEPMTRTDYAAALRRLKRSPDYDPAMDRATDEYLDFLKGLSMSFSEPPFTALEIKVDFSSYVPEGYGTADCIMIGDGKLCVCDYKNGSGVPVEAEENSQMMLYALGALAVFGPVFGDAIHAIHLAIIQPHAGGVKEWDCSRETLEQWGAETVRPAAAQAYAGEGEFCPGDWCRFCRCKSQCSARAAAMLALAPADGELPLPAHSPKAKEGHPLLEDEEIGPILTRAEGLEQWVKDLKEYALGALLAGRTIPGYKVVAGRSSRDWASLDEAFDYLQERGVDSALLWERKPVTVAGLEKVMGKKSFASVADGLVKVKPGKPTLVPEKDRRPAYNAAAAAFAPEEEA